MIRLESIPRLAKRACIGKPATRIHIYERNLIYANGDFPGVGTIPRATRLAGNCTQGRLREEAWTTTASTRISHGTPPVSGDGFGKGTPAVPPAGGTSSRTAESESMPCLAAADTRSALADDARQGALEIRSSLERFFHQATGNTWQKAGTSPCGCRPVRYSITR